MRWEKRERERERARTSEWTSERESLNLACKFEIAAEKNKNNGGERRCRERGDGKTEKIV